MKKLLLFVPCLLLWAQSAKAQGSGDVVIIDTIHYYFNKYYFKTATARENFPLYKSPAATGTAITHVGVMFENSGPLEIVGVEAFIHRHPKTSTASNQGVPYGLYLCEADANGKPKLPALDSVRLLIASSQQAFTMDPIGGNFTSPKTVNGKYFILFRNMSTKEGDTIYIKRTAGATGTSVASATQKNSDGYGWLRHNSTFYSTTNYTASGFGFSTDYEFCLAPIVQYTIQASQQKPPAQDSILCTHQLVNFQNTSSGRFRERMYNLIEFKTYWNKNPSFHVNAVPEFAFPDEESGIAWHFYAEDDKNYYLPTGNNTLLFVTDSCNVGDKDDPNYDPCKDTLNRFEANEFRAKLFGMRYKGGYQKFNYIEYFDQYTHFCNGDCVGLSDNDVIKHVKVYPNPSSSMLHVSGLSGNVKLDIFNMTGQLIGHKEAGIQNSTIDISALPAGNYLLRLSNGNATKNIKIVKN